MGMKFHAAMLANPRSIPEVFNTNAIDDFVETTMDSFILGRRKRSKVLPGRFSFFVVA